MNSLTECKCIATDVNPARFLISCLKLLVFSHLWQKPPVAADYGDVQLLFRWVKLTAINPLVTSFSRFMCAAVLFVRHVLVLKKSSNASLSTCSLDSTWLPFAANLPTWLSSSTHDRRRSSILVLVQISPIQK